MRADDDRRTEPRARNLDRPNASKRNTIERITLVGTAGSGKSTILDELGSTLDRNDNCTVLRCRPAAAEQTWAPAAIERSATLLIEWLVNLRLQP